MAERISTQEVFSKGELSPLMYGRISVQAYYDSLKTAKNVIPLPQGAAGKRFGTEFIAAIPGITSKDEIFFKAFQYLDQCTYLIVFKPDEIDIYLEGLLARNITGTGILAPDIPTIDYTVIQDRFRVSTEQYRPKDLLRKSTERFAVTAVDIAADDMTIAGDFTTGDVLPVVFSVDGVAGVLPAATPALVAGTTYFLEATTANDFKVYDTDVNARAGGATGLVDLTGVGTNTFYATINYKHLITVTSPTSTIAFTDSLEQHGIVVAGTFITAGVLPTSTPQIKAGRIYFFRLATGPADTAVAYSNVIDAINETNPITFSANGTPNNYVQIENSWSLDDIIFKNSPVYDFDGGYDLVQFQVATKTGSGVILTATAGTPFTTAHVGGVFAGDGGIGRIVTYTSSTSVKIDIVRTFNTATSNIAGKISLLAEPAWSDARGWPQKCSSFQNRSVFANTELLPNGVWLSAINDYADFDDIQTEADNAISYLPTSDESNFVRYIVPYRSLTIHTNSGIYSTPLRADTAITPNNFYLAKQDSTPADNVQPRGIDNQIIILSGNDVHSMLWDGANNAYTSSIVSVTSEHLIKSPVDEAAYVDLNRAGSRYVFIVNGDGTMAIYQTLISEEVSGFTPAVLEQPYGNSYFRWVTSNNDGRAWFVTEREIFTDETPVAISAVSGSDVTATASNFDTAIPSLCTFTTTGTLPASTPQIAVLTNYWAIGVDANDFNVYASHADALAGTNAFTFSDTGTGTNNVVPAPLATKFYIEELDFNLYVDCATKYNGVATSTITGLERFNGQNALMNGDGSGYSDEVDSGSFSVTAHGEAVTVEVAQVGFGINVEMKTLPLANAMGSSIKQTDLVYPKHIRTVSFMFNETVGGTVNGKPIAIKTFAEAGIGLPQTPASGLFEIGLMKGWNDFRYNAITISHTEPFDIRLLGIFYKVDM